MKRIALPVSLTFMLVGCHAPLSLDGRASALGEAAQPSAPLYVLDSGTYPGSWVEHGGHYDNVWIDFSVRNDTPAKQVGLTWTINGWKTSTTSYAHYKETLADGRERWGIDLKDAVPWLVWQGATELEYAGFVTMNGATSWSLYRNHYIYNRVTPAAPLRLLSSGATLGSDGQAHVHGVVRALNTDGRRVFVRYTFDGWAHVAEVEASFTGPDFAFDIPVAADPAAVDQVQFATRLEAGGELAWDNNGGQNYAVRLAPALADASYGNAPTTPSAGIKNLIAHAQTALPVSAVTLRFDDGRVMALSNVASLSDGIIASTGGFTSDGQIEAVVTSVGFAVGTHAVTIELAAGPFVRRFPGPALAVDDRIRPLGGTVVGNGVTPWSFARDAQGQIYVLTDQGVLRYATLSAPPVAFAPAPATMSVGDIALDGKGRVYGMGQNNLVRWTADGKIDATFANQGVLALNASWGGQALCWAADMTANADGIYVLDSCNARVVRFTADGAFVDALAVPRVNDNLTYPLLATLHHDKLWVATSWYDQAPRAQLLELAIAPGAPLAITATHPLGHSPDALAVTDGGYWIVHNLSDLEHLDGNGHVDAIWTGGGHITLAPVGSMSLVKHVGLEPDGTIVALSVDGAHIERFASSCTAAQ